MRCASLAVRVLTLLFLIVPLVPGEVLAAEPQDQVITGWLAALWGDPPPGSDLPDAKQFLLVDDEGRDLPISVASSYLPVAERLLNRYVEVELTREAALPGGVLRVGRVQAADAPAGSESPFAPRAVTGSHPWISLPCKFSNISTEPENQAFFQGMYANSPGRLDHYWRELSYNKANIVGSLAVGWRVLPQTQSYYAPTPGSGSNANLGALFNDCADTHDPYVDFTPGGTPYSGINLMFNGLLDCCAWGGGWWKNLDGAARTWRVTWEPPWGYADEAVIAHEMGHGFGLPHSNNADGDSSPYDNPWDVMSAATGYSVSDPTYGRLGKHTISYHKDVLGWIDADEKLVITENGIYTVTLHALGLATTGHYRMIQIPIPGSSGYYTVEARERTGQYEGNIPGTSVILHEVQMGRDEPAWIVDPDVPPAGYADTPGVMWTVGEEFVDAANEIRVSVDSTVDHGFRVTVVVGTFDEIFSDGFEQGDASAWSNVP